MAFNTEFKKKSYIYKMQSQQPIFTQMHKHNRVGCLHQTFSHFTIQYFVHIPTSLRAQNTQSLTAQSAHAKQEKTQHATRRRNIATFPGNVQPFDARDITTNAQIRKRKALPNRALLLRPHANCTCPPAQTASQI